MKEPAVLAQTPEQYKRFGITETIQPFEDGLRTDPTKHGHYEWWYFDAQLDDGTKMVIAFHTKSLAHPNTGLDPLITIELDFPDGGHVHRSASFKAAQFTASTEGCDVQIGENTFVGDLHEYRITATIDDLSVDVTLVSDTQPWRPHTGHIVYGNDEENYFAWLPAVPHGAVTATYRMGDIEVITTGQGYHDHNWGNVSLLEVVNNWYWGRGQAGPYTFITAYIVSEKKYDYTPITVFMLAKDGEVITDDETKVIFATADIHTDEYTNKPYADLHEYRYIDTDTVYDVRYQREETILRTQFINELSGAKRLLAKAAGFDGAYMRFKGEVTVRAEGSVPATDNAVWEIMYIGKNGHEARGQLARP